MNKSTNFIKRAGFITLLGRPNVGKSTLLNALLGSKIAIVTPKPQTTRGRLIGVKNYNDAQLIFVDTPGLVKPSAIGGSLLSRWMNDEALAGYQEADIQVWLVDCQHEISRDSKDIFQILSNKDNKTSKPLILVLNKIDLLADKQQLLPRIQEWNQRYPFQAVIPISAINGDGIKELLNLLSDLLPVGPPLYPEDYLTNQPERFLVAEWIREQVFLRTYQEVPYSSAVTIESWEEKGGPEKRTKIKVHATIHIQRNSHKKILVGQAGKNIKEIGIEARKGLKTLLGCEVHLFLFVRVDENWVNKIQTLRDMGYAGDR